VLLRALRARAINGVKARCVSTFVDRTTTFVDRTMVLRTSA
jgi:hypothetical protein